MRKEVLLASFKRIRHSEKNLVEMPCKIDLLPLEQEDVHSSVSASGLVHSSLRILFTLDNEALPLLISLCPKADIILKRTKINVCTSAIIPNMAEKENILSFKKMSLKN